MNTALKILLLGVSTAIIACGDDTGGAGGGAGAGGGGGADGSTTASTSDTTSASTGDATTASGGGAGGEDPGAGGAGGAGGGDACEENVADCNGCSSMNMGGNPNDLCICNGPPSSADIFATLVECTCTNCAEVCADTACSGMFPSADCQTCIAEQCGTENGDCNAD
jgi:hypothetical protein